MRVAINVNQEEIRAVISAVWPPQTTFEETVTDLEDGWKTSWWLLTRGPRNFSRNLTVRYKGHDWIYRQ
jgi:hypothetical protein